MPEKQTKVKCIMCGKYFDEEPDCNTHDGWVCPDCRTTYDEMKSEIA